MLLHSRHMVLTLIVCLFDEAWGGGCSSPVQPRPPLSPPIVLLVRHRALKRYGWRGQDYKSPSQSNVISLYFRIIKQICKPCFYCISLLHLASQCEDHNYLNISLYYFSKHFSKLSKNILETVG